MNSPTRATTTPNNSLPAQLEQIGLHALAAGMDDFLARATKQRWSPRQILEHLVQSEVDERAHRSLERRLRLWRDDQFEQARVTGALPLAQCLGDVDAIVGGGAQRDSERVSGHQKT